MQRGQCNELHLWSGASHVHRSIALELTGMEPQSHSQARHPRDSAGARWQQGKWVWLERNTTFQCYLWTISRGSTGHLRDLPSDTCPSQRIHLTAWEEFACQSPPSAGCKKDQSSKCHSSSALTPCLSRVRSYTVSSQPLEKHRDCALSGRLHAATCHNTKHKETQARALLCQAGLLAPHKSHQQPQGSDC